MDLKVDTNVSEEYTVSNFRAEICSEFLGRCLVTTLKEEQREVDHRRDRKIISSNPEIGICQKAYTL
jgi:hypothetical protein